MLKMKEALRRISPAVKRKHSSPGFIKSKDYEAAQIENEDRQQTLQLAALSLDDLTSEEDAMFQKYNSRKFSYLDIVDLRESSVGYRQKSKNIIEVLSLDSKGVELSALISGADLSGTDPIKQTLRKSFSGASNRGSNHGKLLPRRKSIEVLLKKQKRKISAPNRRRRTSSFEPQLVLEKAICEGYIEIVKGLITSDQVNVNKLNNRGYAPLHLAAMTESATQIINILLELGAHINIADESGFTPLEVAVNEGCFECAQMLIRKGADQSFIMHGRLDAKKNGKFPRL